MIVTLNNLGNSKLISWKTLSMPSNIVVTVPTYKNRWATMS